jgi:cyclophilin family peptidyl-prolyl cis-trans isomerase
MFKTFVIAAVACSSVEAANPSAVFETSMGSFTAELYLDRVPITVSNFIDLSTTGFYDNLHFHRVIPNFMNQFGCPNSKDPKARNAGQGGPPDGEFKNLVTGSTEKRSNGGNIQDENISKDSNVPGTLSMANTGRPNSGGSQFFLNVATNSNLDWFSGGQSKHPVFGQITDGMDIATAISKVQTRQDNPIEPIMMKSIKITGLEEKEL